MTDLNSLAERCEKATAAEQRSLLIATFEILTANFVATPSVARFMRMLEAEAYESAAMTLVPLDPETDAPMVWALDTNTFVGCEATIYTADTDGPPQIYVEAATPALALCAAALRTRAGGE